MAARAPLDEYAKAECVAGDDDYGIVIALMVTDTLRETVVPLARLASANFSRSRAVLS